MFLHSVRLATYGVWGVPFPPAISWNLEAAPSLVNARRSFAREMGEGNAIYNPVQNLAILDGEWEKNWKGKRDEEDAPGVSLAWRALYPSNLNKTLPKPDQSEASQFLERLSNPFGGARPGLAFAHNTTSDFTWLSGDYGGPSGGPSGAVPEDAGWSRRVWLHKPPSEQKAPTWCSVWGKVKSGTGWAFRVQNGRASMARLTKAWTPEKERALWAAREVEEDDDATAGQREAARSTRQALEDALNIYEKSIDRDGELYGRPFEVVVLPEGAGLSVFLDGKRTVIQLADMEALPKPKGEIATLPTLWDAGPLITGTSHAFFWQNGFPEFASSGALRLGTLLGTYETAKDLPIAQIAPRLNAYLPTGTSVQIARRFTKDKSGKDTKRVEIVAEFSTSDPRRSPILYRVNLVLKGGARDGSQELSFDTKKQELVDAKFDPVLDVAPQFDGENKRRQYQVFVRMKAGATTTLDHALFPGLGATAVHYGVLENLTCTLWLDGVRVLSGGLIKDARLMDARSLGAIGGSTAITEALMGGETVLRLTLCDGWALCEERLTHDEVGDGYFRGAYLRLLLGNVGFKDAELAGIAPEAGGRIKPILPGAKWVVRPRRGQNYAEWLAAFVKTYCPGWVLFQDKDGVWQFQMRSRAPVAAFSSRYDTNTDKTYPGRWTVLRSLELIRDTSEFYNVRSLYGAKGSDGEALSRVWRIEESIRHVPGTPQAASYIGRVKEAPPVEDEAIDTTAEADKKLRFDMQDQGLGRFAGFKTYYHTAGCGGKDLVPGDFVTCDGLLYKVARIPDGSLRDDRMSLATQQMN